MKIIQWIKCMIHNSQPTKYTVIYFRSLCYIIVQRGSTCFIPQGTKFYSWWKPFCPRITSLFQIIYINVQENKTHFNNLHTISSYFTLTHNLCWNRVLQSTSYLLTILTIIEYVGFARNTGVYLQPFFYIMFICLLMLMFLNILMFF